MKNNYQDIFRRYLKKNKLKYTTEREHILDTAFSIHQHFDIEKLYRKIHKNYRNISLATLYRTLPLLVDSGLVRETFRCQGRISYEHTFGHKHHDHLLCMGCGRVTEFSEKKIEELLDRVCSQHNFQPVEHRLNIKGYCRKCQKGGIL